MTPPRGRALVALGSNLAHDGLKPAQLILEAVRHFASEQAPEQVIVRTRSSLWRSPPWPRDDHATRDQPDYVNAIVACDVGAMAPDELVKVLQRIEAQFGRVRRTQWEARTLDLDLIDLDSRAGVFNGITLPHPRAHERAFVLAPLAEVAPDWRHPVLGRSAAELLAELPDREDVERIGALD